MRFVNQTRTVEFQRQRAFGIRLLCKQHAFHVGMLDDRHRFLLDVFAAYTDGAALHALFGVIERGLVASHAQHGRGKANADARLVHHVEHASEPLPRLADQIANGPGATAGRELALAEVEQRVGGAAPPAFVVEASERDVVALAGEIAVGIDHLFRHDEQRYSARARHQLAVGIGDLRQHQMHNVLGDLVLAARDPHLVAGQPVARAERVSFVLQLGARRDVG